MLEISQLKHTMCFNLDWFILLEDGVLYIQVQSLRSGLRNSSQSFYIMAGNPAIAQSSIIGAITVAW